MADERRTEDEEPRRAPRGTRRERAHASAGRLAALEVVRRVREREAFTHDVLEAVVNGKRSLSREDRAFATALSLGVAATVGTLDEVIDGVLDSPRDVKADVRDALRISAYEMLFLGKDAYAAVDQGVELVRVVAPQAAGLANAVLRRVARAAKLFPFGNPETDLGAAARLEGFPEDLATYLAEDLGEAAARDLMAASNGQAPLYVAVNAARADDEEVAALLRAAGSEVEQGYAGGRPVEGCLRVLKPRVLADGRIRKLVAEGALLVADASAQAVARIALPPRKPESFLEVCSGRGTKTVLLQSGALRAYGSQMNLTAVDSHRFKAQIVRERAWDYGIELAASIAGDARDLDRHLGTQLFDAALVDAPCSGLGTLRRHPEIRWRLSDRDVDELAALGLAILSETARHIRHGGMLTYATCTVTRAENADVVRRFLESEAGSGFSLAPIGEASCFAPAAVPGGPDAHFAVRLVRSAGGLAPSTTR